MSAPKIASASSSNSAAQGRAVGRLFDGDDPGTVIVAPDLDLLSA